MDTRDSAHNDAKDKKTGKAVSKYHKPILAKLTKTKSVLGSVGCGGGSIPV